LMVARGPQANVQMQNMLPVFSNGRRRVKATQ
jgi:hypothetical protein